MDVTAAIANLHAVLTETLERHNAIDMQGERDFIGYIGQEEDGRYFNDIYKYGVHHGKVHGTSIEDVKQRAFETYRDS